MFHMEEPDGIPQGGGLADVGYKMLRVQAGPETMQPAGRWSPTNGDSAGLQ